MQSASSSGDSSDGAGCPGKALLRGPVAETESSYAQQPGNALRHDRRRVRRREELQRSLLLLDLQPAGPDRNPEDVLVREGDHEALAGERLPVLHGSTDPAADLFGNGFEHRRRWVAAPADDERALGKVLGESSPTARASARQVHELVDVPEHDRDRAVAVSPQAPARASSGEPRADRAARAPGTSFEEAASLLAVSPRS